jgi:hypothetical protein
MGEVTGDFLRRADVAADPSGVTVTVNATP